ncbi:hypothetical protein JQ616_02390 [Bradyrhizobium tropiciagri]|uniref:hypothetical protein n=1 Tax=Bradyrhizobium tropiciagri TaxID=312253 RepID=UPI001BA5B09B|nr:hypothetical protein [Bradyrhizobium tropiciagri]
MAGQGRAQQSGTHRSIRFLITEADTPGFWQYSFSIGDRNFTGRIQAVLGLLAARRVKMKIDRLLKHNAPVEGVETPPPLVPPAGPKE